MSIWRTNFDSGLLNLAEKGIAQPKGVLFGTVRVISYWNSLARLVVDSLSLAILKSRSDDFLKEML